MKMLIRLGLFLCFLNFIPNIYSRSVREDDVSPPVLLHDVELEPFYHSHPDGSKPTEKDIQALRASYGMQSKDQLDNSPQITADLFENELDDAARPLYDDAVDENEDFDDLDDGLYTSPADYDQDADEGDDDYYDDVEESVEDYDEDDEVYEDAGEDESNEDEDMDYYEGGDEDDYDDDDVEDGDFYDYDRNDVETDFIADSEDDVPDMFHDYSAPLTSQIKHKTKRDLRNIKSFESYVAAAPHYGTAPYTAGPQEQAVVPLPLSEEAPVPTDQRVVQLLNEVEDLLRGAMLEQNQDGEELDDFLDQEGAFQTDYDELYSEEDYDDDDYEEYDDEYSNDNDDSSQTTTQSTTTTTPAPEHSSLAPNATSSTTAAPDAEEKDNSDKEKDTSDKKEPDSDAKEDDSNKKDDSTKKGKESGKTENDSDKKDNSTKPEGKQSAETENDSDNKEKDDESDKKAETSSRKRRDISDANPPTAAETSDLNPPTFDTQAQRTQRSLRHRKGSRLTNNDAKRKAEKLLRSLGPHSRRMGYLIMKNMRKMHNRSNGKPNKHHRSRRGANRSNRRKGRKRNRSRQNEAYSSGSNASNQPTTRNSMLSGGDSSQEALAALQYLANNGGGSSTGASYGTQNINSERLAQDELDQQLPYQDPQQDPAFSTEYDPVCPQPQSYPDAWYVFWTDGGRHVRYMDRSGSLRDRDLSGQAVLPLPLPAYTGWQNDRYALEIGLNRQSTVTAIVIAPQTQISAVWLEVNDPEDGWTVVKDAQGDKQVFQVPADGYTQLPEPTPAMGVRFYPLAWTNVPNYVVPDIVICA